MFLGGILIFFDMGESGISILKEMSETVPVEILDFLDKQDINHGMSKKRINCSEVAAAVRKKFSGDYLGICQNRRNRLILNIQEGIIPQKPTVILTL